jgi:hypothetical protein
VNTLLAKIPIREFGDKKFSMWFISGKRVFAVEGTLSWWLHILFLMIYKGRGI